MWLHCKHKRESCKNNLNPSSYVCESVGFLMLIKPRPLGRERLSVSLAVSYVAYVTRSIFTVSAMALLKNMALSPKRQARGVRGLVLIHIAMTYKWVFATVILVSAWKPAKFFPICWRVSPPRWHWTGIKSIHFDTLSHFEKSLLLC